MRAFTVTMQPIVIFALSLYAICSADPDLSYTIFGGSFDSCQFRPADVTSGEGLCSNDIVIDASDVFQGSDLTWEILVQACPNLLIGGCADSDWVEGDEHDMTTDLVWPRFSACDECPRCPCTTDGNITYNTYSYTTFNTDSAFSVSQCYECECNSWYFFGGNQVLALECSTGSANTPTFDSPAELASAECPYDNANPVTTEAISGINTYSLYHFIVCHVMIVKINTI